MKPLILALSLLAPLASQAAEIHCKTEGTAGPIDLKITTEGRLDLPKAKITFTAVGFQHTVFQTVVDEVLRTDGDKIGVRLSTLNRSGEVDQESGVAEVTLDVRRFYDKVLARGPGKITFTKRPKVRGMLVLLDNYDLTDCQGAL